MNPPDSSSSVAKFPVLPRKRPRSSCTASCLCGACEIETVGEPKLVANCHCSQCRRALSAAYATLAFFDPESVKTTKGESHFVSYMTGEHERFSCILCSSKVYAHLQYVGQKAIYNNMFTAPNHGPGGKIGRAFTPTMHFFYTSGNTNIVDGLPKYTDLPAELGGTDWQVDEVYHGSSVDEAAILASSPAAVDARWRSGRCRQEERRERVVREELQDREHAAMCAAYCERKQKSRTRWDLEEVERQTLRDKIHDGSATLLDIQMHGNYCDGCCLCSSGATDRWRVALRR